MSFIDIASEIEGRQDEHAVEGGEYKLRILSADVWNNEAFRVRFEITDDPYAKSLSGFINLPSSGRDPKEQNRYKNNLAAFMQAFSLGGSVEVAEDNTIPAWVGQEGWALLSDPVDKADGYGPQNRIKKYVG